MTDDADAEPPPSSGVEGALDVGDLVESALAAAAGPARDRGLALASRIAGDVIRHREGDAERLRPVLDEMIADAIARTTAGTITLRVDTAPGEELLLAVIDGDPGGPAEPDLDAGRQRAAALGGRLWIEPASAGGSAVVIALRLPVAVPGEMHGPPIDRAALLDRVGGDRALAHDLLEIFVAHHLDVVAPVRAAVAASDPIAIARAAHGARGAVAMICAHAAVALCTEIEARAINPAACARLVDRLERELRRGAALVVSELGGASRP